MSSAHLDHLLHALQSVKQSGRGYYARCPAHDDSKGKLYITEKDDGKITLHCYHGCRSAEVIGALGLSFSDLFPPRIEYRRGVRRPVVPLRPLRKHYDFEAPSAFMCGTNLAHNVVLETAIDWDMQVEFQSICWRVRRFRSYQKYGPTLKPQPVIQPPEWAVVGLSAPGAA